MTDTNDLFVCVNKKCQYEAYWAAGVDYDLAETIHCGAKMTKVSMDPMSPSEKEGYRSKAAKMLTPTPHVAAFYRRQMDEDSTLPDPAVLWERLGSLFRGFTTSRSRAANW